MKRLIVTAFGPCLLAIFLNGRSPLVTLPLEKLLPSKGSIKMTEKSVRGDTPLNFSNYCIISMNSGGKQILAKALDADHEKILLRVGATKVIHPERDMAICVFRSLSRPNTLDFIPLSDDFDLIQIEPPQEFINRNLKDLDLRARSNVHIITIKKPTPESFVLVPPAGYEIQATDTLLIV